MAEKKKVAVMGRTKRKLAIVYLISMLCLSAVCQADVANMRPSNAIDISEVERSREESRSFQGPSFDCGKASTKVEKTICDYRHLSGLDRKLNEVYKQKRVIPKIRESVRRSQLDWLRNKRAKCESVEGMAFDSSGSRIVSCISAAYRSRIQELNNLGVSGSLKPDDPPLVSGSIKHKITKGCQYEICQRYVELMNRVQPNPRTSFDLPYSFDHIALQQGFSKVPWKTIDKNKHQDAVLLYWIKWKKLSRADMSVKDNKKAYKKFFSDIEHLWRVTMDINFDGRKEVVYRFPSDGFRNIYFIDDPNIPSEHAHRSRIYGDILYYKGRVYIFQGKKFSTLLETYGSNYVVNDKDVCEFKLTSKEK